MSPSRPRSRVRPAPRSGARHSTVPRQAPARGGGAPRTGLPPLVSRPRPSIRSPRTAARPKGAAPPARTAVGRIIDDSEASLLDVVDNLLNRGVVLDADVVLSLAGVDLVYLRLSALLCAADRLLPRKAP